MEMTRVLPSNLNFTACREDLKLPSLEDMRVYWHTKMLAAQRYMAVMNEGFSLALHLNNERYTDELEANIRKDFSTQRPRVIDSLEDPDLSWTDLIRETNEASFTQVDKGVFSCSVRRKHTVQMTAEDRKQVSHYHSISVVHQIPQQKHVHIERDTISELRTFISACKKDREEAAKFEEKLDDLLRERDYELRELQETWITSSRSISSPRNLPSESTNISTGGLPGALPSPQPHEPLVPPGVFDRPVPRWSREPSPADSVIIIDSDDDPQQATTSHQPRTETRISTRTPTQLAPNFNPDKTQEAPLSYSATDQQLTLRTQDGGQITRAPIMRAPIGPRGSIPRTPEEKLHDSHFIAFQHDRKIPWSRIRENYEQRFKVARTQGTLTVKYFRLPKEERVSSGCVALKLHSRPRLKELVERLWPG